MAEDLPLPATGISQDVDIAETSVGTFTVDNPDASVGTATTTAVGSGSAAELDAGDSDSVTLLWDTSGAATITVEVSDDGTNWYQVDAIPGTQPPGAETKAESFEIGSRHVRAHIDANVNRLVVSAKGA